MRVYLVDGCFYGTFCETGERAAKGEQGGNCCHSMYCLCMADIPPTREATPSETARFLDSLAKIADERLYENNNNL